MSGTSPIMQRYIEKTSKSAELAVQALELYPTGITHDSRFQKPYTIYIERAQGSKKWDYDGNEYIDYIGGHGGHIAGHSHPNVVKAVQDAITRGTQVGGNTKDEVVYGQLVKQLVPCAERMRLTMSGTESTLLALRIARAFTGKDKTIQIRKNFHGWHDQVASSYQDLPPQEPARGVTQANAANTLLIPPGDADALEAVLKQHDDVAAIILEPTGTHMGMAPVPEDYLQRVRELTAAAGVIMILDEVITGFRISPGGAQAYYGVTPDLSTHAKIACGGLPGGIVCGRKDILDVLDFDVMAQKHQEKVQHNGTFNGNLVSMAAGTALLTMVRDDNLCEKANAAAERLREGLNRALVDLNMPWSVYGEHSAFFIFTNPDSDRLHPQDFDPLSKPFKTLMGANPAVTQEIVAALVNNGVHIGRFPGGWTSSAHSDNDIDETIDRMTTAFRELRDQ